MAASITVAIIELDDTSHAMVTHWSRILAVVIRPNGVWRGVLSPVLQRELVEVASYSVGPKEPGEVMVGIGDPMTKI